MATKISADPQWPVPPREPTHDERFVMSSLAREYATLPSGGALLEVGCGLEIHHVLSAAPRVAHIDLADYRGDNLVEIRKWIARALQAQPCISSEGGARDLRVGPRLPP